MLGPTFGYFPGGGSVCVCTQGGGLPFTFFNVAFVQSEQDSSPRPDCVQTPRSGALAETGLPPALTRRAAGEVLVTRVLSHQPRAALTRLTAFSWPIKSLCNAEPGVWVLLPCYLAMRPGASPPLGLLSPICQKAGTKPRGSRYQKISNPVVT